MKITEYQLEFFITETCPYKFEFHRKNVNRLMKERGSISVTYEDAFDRSYWLNNYRSSRDRTYLIWLMKNA